jgi:hypothetical protein
VAESLYKRAKDQFESEIKIKDQILQNMEIEKKRLLHEVKIAKVILSDDALCKAANSRFKEAVAEINAENEDKFLAKNSFMNELIADKDYR